MVHRRAIRVIENAWILKKENKAAIVVQRNWKMYCAKKQFAYLKLQRANKATLIQAVFRGYLARRNLRKCHQAAITIQTVYRKWRALSQFMLLKKSAICLQQKYRAKVIGRAQRLRYLRYKDMVKNKAAKTIQRFWRRRREIKASTRIQSYWRMHSARKELAHLKQERFELLSRSAIIIQAAYRGFVVKKNLWLCHKAACLIQAHFKGWRLQQQYSKLKLYTVRIQQIHRAKTVGKVQRNKFLSYRMMIHGRAAKTIQRAWKKHKLSQACTVIQRYFRMYSAKKVLADLKKQRMQLLFKNASVIQSAYRSYIVRKHLKICRQAATTIQKYFRGWHCRSHYLKMKKTSIRIQRNYRAKIAGHIQRTKYLNYKNMIKRRAVRVIQGAWRQFLFNREIKRKNLAATVIQKNWRMYLAKKKLLSLKEQRNREWCSAVVIQAAFRGFALRRHLTKLHEAALIIQKNYHRWHARSRYARLRSLVLRIQQVFRAKAVGRVQRFKYLSYLSMVKNKAAKTIQRFWRRRREIKASTRIQSYWRMHSARKELACLKQERFELLSRSAIIIQIQERAAKKIQRAWRNYKKSKCAIIIQSYWRRHLAQKRLACLKEEKRLQWLSQKAVLIQAVYRGYSVRKHVAKCHQSASIIQRHYRVWLTRKELQPIADMQRAKFVTFRNNIICFQKAARFYLQNRYNSAVKIQACWRGYQMRKKITDKKICQAREKILAADNSEFKTLKNRTTRALESLFKDDLLQNMISALEDLDKCTQLSPICCERLVQSGGVSILLHTVRRCNRSVPHMELIRLITNILLNLVKYNKTVDYVWNEKHIFEIILSLMKIFREKGAIIFSKCCSLIWIFCQDPDKAQAMKENAVSCEQIRSFHYLLTRKQTIEAKLQVAKAIANKSFCLPSLKSSNTSILQKRTQRESLLIDPDWMLGQNRRREFKDPIVAISWIMKYLDLKSK